MMQVPLVKYLNSGNGLLEGQALLYQNVNHPANAHKRRVTFKRWTNTGICVEEFPGTVYPGNFWVIFKTLTELALNDEYPPVVI